MNYELEIQKSLPHDFYGLNGDRPPLVAGSGSATFRSSSLTLGTIQALTQFRENTSFSVEVWFLPVAGTVTAIGNDTGGVSYDGETFTLSLLSESATWTPPETKSFHVVLTYDTETLTLFIDGEIVAELLYQGDDFLADNDLDINRGTGSAIYDSAAVYYRPLPRDEVRLHYLWGRDLLPSRETAAAHGGSTWNLVYANVQVLQTITYDSENWDQGRPTNVSFLDNLVGQVGGGSWTASIPMDALTDETAGINISFAGQGTVSYSTDATVWTPVTNNTTVLEDVDATDLVVYVKVDLLEDEVFEYIRLDLLAERLVPPFTGSRNLTFSSTELDHTPGLQLDYHVDQGAKIGGYLQIEPDDSESPVDVQTIEVWARVDDTDGWFMGISGSQYVSVVSGSYTYAAMTAYRNGQPVSNGAQPAGEWAHYVFVLNAPVNLPIRFGLNLSDANDLDMSVGHVAVYEEVLSAAEVQALYQANIGSPLLRVNDTTALTVSESDPELEFYALSWSS